MEMKTLLLIIAIAIFGGIIAYIGAKRPQWEKQKIINKELQAIELLQEWIQEQKQLRSGYRSKMDEAHKSANILRQIVEEKENVLCKLDDKYCYTKKHIVYETNTLTGVVSNRTWDKWRVNSEWQRHRVRYFTWTVDEKVNKLLKIYWLSKTVNIWKKYWEEYKIKYPVAICIWFADSSLWASTKSKYNIWNVWNNDRWDIVHFNSIDDWIRAIYRTLNNKYLINNNIIWELSQWWRTNLWLKWCAEKWEYCYATSTENWNINVINCLNMLYNEEKDESFEFRLVN